MVVSVIIHGVLLVFEIIPYLFDALGMLQCITETKYSVVENGPFPSFLQRAELMDIVMRNVFQRLLEALRRTLLTHTDDIKKVKSNNGY